MYRWFGRSGTTHRRMHVRLVAMPLTVALLALVVVVVRGAVQDASARGAASASAQSGTSIFVPDQSAGPLLQPPVISSRNGVLRAQDTVVRAGPPGSGEPVLW